MSKPANAANHLSHDGRARRVYRPGTKHALYRPKRGANVCFHLLPEPGYGWSVIVTVGKDKRDSGCTQGRDIREALFMARDLAEFMVESGKVNRQFTVKRYADEEAWGYYPQ